MGVVIMEVGGWVSMQVYKVYKSSWWLHWMSIEWTETASLRCSAAERQHFSLAPCGWAVRALGRRLPCQHLCRS